MKAGMDPFYRMKKADVLAMFRMVKDMPAKDKVINIAFSVCIATVFGDHLSFTANFQPNLILPIMLGRRLWQLPFLFIWHLNCPFQRLCS